MNQIVSKLVVMLVCIGLAIARISPVHAAASPAASIRTDLVEIARLSEKLMGVYGRPNEQADVAAAREIVERTSDAELEPLRAAAPFLSEWRARLEQQVPQTLKAHKRSSARSASGYPSSVDYPSPCTVDIAPGGVLAALITLQVADAALAAVEYVCEQSIPIPLIGGSINGEAACVAFSIIRSTAAIAYDLVSFCFGERHGARLSSADERLLHLHEDMETRDENQHSRLLDLNSDMVDHRTNTSNRMTTLDNRLADLRVSLTGHTDEIDALLAATVVAVDAQHNQTLALVRRLDIERALSEQRRQEVVSLSLPAGGQGDLDIVRQVVSETISNFTNAGLSVGDAQQYYSRGVTEQGAGNYRTAFRQYVIAYQQCVRGVQ